MEHKTRRRAFHVTEGHRPVFASNGKPNAKTMICVICGRTARRADAADLLARGAIVFMDAAEPMKDSRA